MEEQTSLNREAKQRKRRVEPLPAPAVHTPSTVLALIERVTLDPCAGVEKLDRLAAIYERLEAKEAERSFNAAKSRTLKKLAGIKIVKNRPVLSDINNGKQRDTVEAFKYAPLEEIDKHLRPLLAEEQMDLSYSDEPWDGGGILIRGRLKHLPGGHYEFVYAGAARHDGWQIECAGGRQHQLLPAPLCRLQHLQHRGCRR